MRRLCQWRLWVEANAKERPCDKPAVAHITWPGAKQGTFYYCAEHYDIRLSEIRNVGRIDVLEASGVR